MVPVAGGRLSVRAGGSGDLSLRGRPMAASHMHAGKADFPAHSIARISFNTCSPAPRSEGLRTLRTAGDPAGTELLVMWVAVVVKLAQA